MRLDAADRLSKMCGTTLNRFEIYGHFRHYAALSPPCTDLNTVLQPFGCSRTTLETEQQVQIVAAQLCTVVNVRLIFPISS